MGGSLLNEGDRYLGRYHVQMSLGTPVAHLHDKEGVFVFNRKAAVDKGEVVIDGGLRLHANGLPLELPQENIERVTDDDGNVLYQRELAAA